MRTRLCGFFSFFLLSWSAFTLGIANEDSCAEEVACAYSCVAISSFFVSLWGNSFQFCLMHATSNLSRHARTTSMSETRNHYFGSKPDVGRSAEVRD